MDKHGEGFKAAQGRGGNRMNKGKAVGAGQTAGRYGKPAGGSRSFGKPATGRPVSARPTETRLLDDTAKVEGTPRFAHPASAENTKADATPRRYGKPASARPAGGSRSFGKPATGRPASARPMGKPMPHRDTVEAPKQTMSLGARRVALDTLADVHQRGAYASLALQKRLNESRLSAVDKRLCTALVYGVLENQIKLDYALDKLMDRPTNEAIQRDILRLGAYQILMLDRVPDSAAVDESVKLIKAMGMEGASGFLNAVLRNLSRGKGALEWPRREDGLEKYLHVEYSQPLWIVERILSDYGEEQGEQILSARSSTHETVIRANSMRLTDEELEKRMTQKEWTWTHGLAPHAYLVSGVGDPTLDDDYRKGLYSVQGQSSMLAAMSVGVKNGMHVLDACAAPGGKACYMAETMQGTGRVFAWDLHEHRVKLMESAKRRLGLENLRLMVRDATSYREDLDATMDAVLLDAPCSGLGVADDKPDLKYRVTEQSVAELTEMQREMLDTVCRYVKPGGVLVYSTCTLLKDENERQIGAFLLRHPEYTVEPLPETIPAQLRERQTALGLQLLPGRDGVEGFYMVRLRKGRA